MSAKLYSVYPEILSKINTPLGDFRIAACPPGDEFSVTIIQDKVENISGGSIEGESQRWIQRTEPAANIAEWLANEDEFGPRGVFVSKFEDPSKEEIASAKSKRDKFFKKEFDLASDNWEKNATRRAITDVARLAAKHLGASPEWLSADAANSDRAECPECAEMIKKKANTCKFCGWKRNSAAVAPPVPPKQQQPVAR